MTLVTPKQSFLNAELRRFCSTLSRYGIARPSELGGGAGVPYLLALTKVGRCG
ncbi:MAG: hypothetical protein RLZZ324_702, partial [Candidatus Parcubacteria bacterium]